MNKSVSPLATPPAANTSTPPAAPAVRPAPQHANQRSGTSSTRPRSTDDSGTTSALQNPSPSELQAWLSAWAGPDAHLKIPDATSPMSTDSQIDTANPWSQALAAGDPLNEANGHALPVGLQALTGPLSLQVEGLAGHLPFELVLNPMQNGMRVQLRARTERQRRQLVELVDEARREGRDADHTDIEVVLCTDTPTLPLPPGA